MQVQYIDAKTSNSLIQLAQNELRQRQDKTRQDIYFSNNNKETNVAWVT